MQRVEQEFEQSLRLTRDAVSSGAWLYPFYGGVYLVSNPALLRGLYPVLLQALTASVAVTAGLFVFTYFPQIAIFSVILGPLAIIPATLLVLVESYFLTTFITKTFLFRSAQDHISILTGTIYHPVDAVLRKKGHGALVETGNIKRQKNKLKSTAFQDLTEPITASFGRFSKEGILRYVLTAPLNLIPVVGTAMFLLYNGKKSGPSFHERFFYLKGVNESTARKFVHQRRGAYTAFGAAALALNLLPVVGSIFNLASVVGAALWASSMEKSDQFRIQGQPETVPDSQASKND